MMRALDEILFNRKIASFGSIAEESLQHIAEQHHNATLFLLL